MISLLGKILLELSQPERLRMVDHWIHPLQARHSKVQMANGAKRGAYLFHQTHVIPEDLVYFEVKLLQECPLGCVNPWHHDLIDLEAGPAMQKRPHSKRFSWEWAEVDNRVALVWAIMQGRFDPKTKVVTLEEFYKDHATEEERRTRRSRLSSKGRRLAQG